MLKSSGKKRRTFYEGSGHKFRGLTYEPLHDWIVTSRKVEDEGVELVFLLLSENKDVEPIEIKRVLLTPTRYS